MVLFDKYDFMQVLYLVGFTPKLISLLTGQEIVDNDDDDEDTTTSEVQLSGAITLPPDFFDLIIIDECHRSIYGNWKKVLGYFNTATSSA